jgi:uncharacterized membrane protein YeaQ/YmgE (transglycosylase-associated protein family)
MGFFAWIIFGLIAGVIAKLIMPGRDPGGWIVTILIGIAGGVTGGWIGNAIWGVGITGFNFPSLAMAVLGAVILLWLYRVFFGRRRDVRDDINRRRAA